MELELVYSELTDQALSYNSWSEISGIVLNTFVLRISKKQSAKQSAKR